MIIFCILFLISFYLFLKDNKIKLFVALMAMQTFVLILFLLEYSNGTIEYLISDGKRYFEEASSYVNDNDRKIWGLVNLIIKEYDFYPEIFIKFINIPILFVFVFFLNKTFKLVSNNLILIYPFLFFLSISNLRDILIWLIALLIIRAFYIHKSIILLGFNGLLLYFLRPAMLAPIFAFFILHYLYRLFFNNSKETSKTSKLKYFYLIIIMFGAIGVFSTVLGNKINRISYSLSYRYTEGLEDRIEERSSGAIKNTNLKSALLMGAVRYIISPIPTSKIKSLLSDKPEVQYGYFTEYIRVYSQLIYYYLLISIVYNYKRILFVLKSFNVGQLGYLFWLFSFFPIYAFYHFGTGHQRLKLPFQIFILIIYLYIQQSKKEKIING